tara:strand:+ start:1327 stop:1932 length:606 start_codon:yes stop_codon:yes gene_type:complete
MTFRITPTSELDAVNTLLSIIGEAPVNSLENNTGVDVALALQILNETNVEVQSRGWHFNTDINILVNLDDDSKLPLASNVVSCDVAKKSATDINIVYRNGYVYNLDDHTDIFTSELYVDQITIQKFDQLPEAFRKLIVTRAGRKYQARVVGSTELAGFTEMDEQVATVDAERIDASTADYNVLTGTHTTYSIINRPRRRTY